MFKEKVVKFCHQILLFHGNVDVITSDYGQRHSFKFWIDIYIILNTCKYLLETTAPNKRNISIVERDIIIFFSRIFYLYLVKRYLDFLCVMYLGLIEEISAHIILLTLMLEYIINFIMIRNLCESVNFNKEEDTGPNKK